MARPPVTTHGAAFHSTVWQLRKDGHLLAADIWTVAPAGLELRYTLNATIAEVLPFCDTMAWPHALEVALTRRYDLEACGWRSRDR